MSKITTHTPVRPISAEQLLRDAAFVLRMTQKVKEEILQSLTGRAKGETPGFCGDTSDERIGEEQEHHQSNPRVLIRATPPAPVVSSGRGMTIAQ